METTGEISETVYIMSFNSETFFSLLRKPSGLNTFTGPVWLVTSCVLSPSGTLLRLVVSFERIIFDIS